MYPLKFDILSNERCNEVSNQLFHLESQGKYKIWRVPNSRAFYNPPIGIQLLHELKDKISKVIGLHLQPTYSYARIYRRGDELPKHIDRKASEFGVSITTESDTDWPMYFEVDGDETKEVCGIGQAVIYKGSETPHWRDKLNGELQVQLLLFYVDSNGEYSNLENDKFLGTYLNKQIPNL